MKSMTAEQRNHMLLCDPVSSVIPKMAVPTIISMLITNIYNMADTFFVSQIGTSASGAVGVIFSAMAIIQAISFMIGMGSGTHVSQALGAGKFITSLTMTVFYVLLYYVWRQRYQIKGKSGLTASIYLLSAVRVVLCMMPQNQWLSATSPLSWGIYRNIPFALLGLLIIVLFYRSAKEHNDAAFRWMWLTIVLSFGFYIPVVLWADAIPMIGMLMIPKTCAYVWTVLIGFFAMKKECK